MLKFLCFAALLAVASGALTVVTAGGIDAAVDLANPTVFFIGVEGAGADPENLPYMRNEYVYVGDVTKAGSTVTNGNSVDNTYDVSTDGCGDDANYHCYYMVAADTLGGTVSASNTIVYTANYLARSSFPADRYTIPCSTCSWLPTDVQMREAAWTVSPGNYKFQFFVWNWNWASTSTHFRVQMKVQGFNMDSLDFWFNDDPTLDSIASIAGMQLMNVHFKGTTTKGISVDSVYTFQQKFNIGDDSFATVSVTGEPATGGGLIVNYDMAKADLSDPAGWFLYDPDILATAVTVNGAASVAASAVVLLAAVVTGAILA